VKKQGKKFENKSDKKGEKPTKHTAVSEMGYKPSSELMEKYGIGNKNPFKESSQMGNPHTNSGQERIPVNQNFSNFSSQAPAQPPFTNPQANAVFNQG